jgi:steroid delta-isomerase-like uncharacterized protein
MKPSTQATSMGQLLFLPPMPLCITQARRIPSTRKGFKQFGGVFLTAFPGGKHTIDDLIADENRVASRVTYRGTHTGDLMGIPPTGKTVTVSAMIIDQFANGKIVETWRLFDQMGMMQQLGVIPTPGQPG